MSGWKRAGNISIAIICIIIMIGGTLFTSPVISKAREEEQEFQAVWISYLEFADRLKDPATGTMGFTMERFEAVIDDMFDQVVNLKMNAVVVQVRPFADAMYPSENFPWSKYISGTQGKDPGFDPLEYMVAAAHKRGLKFHAWINPYRITSGSTDVKLLSKDNSARIWLTNKTKEDDRRVLSYGGSLYYNPSDTGVQFLIIDGIKEIVEKYDVDGIHFDDYFYPTFGSEYAKVFDEKEYQTEVKWRKKNDVEITSIADWRRENVNYLIEYVYLTIKDINPEVVFGISPGGFIDSLTRDDRYYCDIETWLSEPGYIDYICPQIYWTFSNASYPYDKTLDRWLKLKTNPDVKMYVGIATYQSGSDQPDWKKDSAMLKKQIEYGRKTGQVDGYIYFRYDYFFKKETKAGVQKLLKIL